MEQGTLAQWNKSADPSSKDGEDPITLAYYVIFALMIPVGYFIAVLYNLHIFHWVMSLEGGPDEPTNLTLLVALLLRHAG